MAACDAYFSRLLLDELFDRLGHRRRSAGLSDAVFAMVANRLQDPSSKRRCVTDWLGADAALPEGRDAPSLDRLYRALDAVADAKAEIEAHCFTELCNLANLDLRLVCYDLTSTYFEGEEKTSDRFPSKAFGYSRDHRGDRPQIVIGLLVTSDGIPIAHHVFSGNTADRSSLPQVMADLQARFGVGRIALVADRGLISEENLALVQANGFDHVLATRLHRDPAVARCFSTKITHGVFTWDYDEQAMDYEERLLSGRYVITTSLDKKTASTAQVVGHYKALQSVERRFRVLKDFLALRPVFHYTEKRVRGHVAICVLAAVLEAVMSIDLKARKLTDPDLEGQHLSARRGLRELERIRMVRFSDADGNQRQVVTRPSPFQAEILAALGVDTYG